MYCTNCRCEYQGWRTNCPVCRTPLVKIPREEDKPPPAMDNSSKPPKVNLFEVLSAKDGVLEIELETTKHARNQAMRFPYLGYGYAWAQEMRGENGDVQVRLTTTEVGKDKGYTFPYFGFGFAWPIRLSGSVGGTPVELHAVEVRRQKRTGFPYRGYGFAWTERFSGTCGEGIIVELRTTEVAKERRYRFPYFGFGYAWEKRLVLRLVLETENLEPRPVEAVEAQAVPA